KEVAGCEERFCRRHRPLLSIQRRLALCVLGRGWVASSDHRHVWLRSTHLLHFPTHTYRAVCLIDCDICPAYQFPSHDWPRELPPVRQPERQRTGLERIGGGHQPADYRIAALSVQQFTGLEVTLGGSDGVGPEAGRAASRLVAH